MPEDTQPQLEARQQKLSELLAELRSSEESPERAAIVLNNLGVVSQLLGNHDRAHSFYRQSAALSESRFGKDYPLIAQSLSNEASLYRLAEAFPKAEACFQKAQLIWDKRGWPAEDQLNADTVRLKESLDDEALQEVPIWTERPRKGQVFPDYLTAVQALKKSVEAEAVTKEQLTAILARFGRWYHNVPLTSRISTNPAGGSHPLDRWNVVLKPHVPESVKDKTVLDIGCNSGYFGSQFKQRGASRVVGIDVQASVLAQARFMTHWTNTPIELYEMSAYDVDRLNSTFDIVVFVGVLYHLKHPLYALEKIAALCKDTMYFQSVIRGPREDFDPAEDYDSREEKAFTEPAYPRMYFVEKKFNGDSTNWWLATRSCLKAMLRTVGFTRIYDTVSPDTFVCVK